jgi:hypothetical protein
MLAAEEKRMRWWGMDMRPRWRRRVAVMVTYLAFIPALASSGAGWWGHPIVAMVTFVFAVMLFGVFGSFGPLKNFKGERRVVRVDGLDRWTQYKFGVSSFEEATDEQKDYVLQTYSVGRRVILKQSSLDERELQERDEAVRWAMGWIGLFVAGYAGTYANAHHPVAGTEVGADLWTILVLMVTLPSARVLWRERDPREMSGEMELVEKEA